MRHDGSHLIRPIVAALGHDIVEPGKFKAPIDQAEGQVICWRRDPRNRMAATWRFWSARDPSGAPNKPRKARLLANAAISVDGQIAWLLDDAGFLPEMLRWARIWCRWPDALIVHFEDMASRGPEEIGRIAAHLGKARDDQRDAEIWDQIWLKGRTYTGKHSDWREYFGPQANETWHRLGGAELLELMGYA